MTILCQHIISSIIGTVQLLSHVHGSGFYHCDCCLVSHFMGVDNFDKWGAQLLKSSWLHVTRAEFIYLDIDFCTCNTAHNLEAFFHLLFSFGHPFAVTAFTHSNMCLKSGGLHPPLPPLFYTFALRGHLAATQDVPNSFISNLRQDALSIQSEKNHSAQHNKDGPTP